MKQLAWYHATPEGSKKSRLTVLKETHGEDDDSFLQFPELDAAGYLIGLLQEAGLMLNVGMGPFPLTWTEIDAWCRTTKLGLSVWEKLTIKEMSEVYTAELGKSTGKTCVQPYTPAPDPEAIDRAAVSSKIGNILRSFKRKKE